MEDSHVTERVRILAELRGNQQSSHNFMVEILRHLVPTAVRPTNS